MISDNIESFDFAFVDSGTGGLPYMLYLKNMCPWASCVYYGDAKNFPYGTKTHEEIVSCIVPVVGEIIKKHHPRAVVIACNTISVNALDDLRNAYPDVPIIGTVPAIKLAAKVTKNHRIGLLATKASVNSPYSQKLKDEYASDCYMALRGDTELIDFIEKKSFTAESAEIEKACQPAVDFFRKENCDTIILACTHFLNISDIIQKVCGEDIKVVDSRDGVVRRALDLVKIEKSDKNPVPEVYVTGGNSYMEYEAVCKKNGFIFHKPE